MFTRRNTRRGVVLVVLFCLCSLASTSLLAVNYCDWKMDMYIEPRVLQVGQTGNVRFTFWAYPDPTRAEVVLLSGGPAIPAVKQPSGAWTFEVPAAKALDSYQTGLGHNFFGRLNEYDGDVLAVPSNLIVNVRDETMPDVPIRTVTNAYGQAQMSRHVLNIRDENAYYFGAVMPGVPADVFKRFYSYRQDDFDFLGVVGEGMAFENRHYEGVRNTTQGLGLALTNNGAAYGSQNKLQGIVNFPNDNMFDLAETGLSHEIGHRWCCFLNLPALVPGRAHWPMGDVAYGIMGMSIGGGEGGMFAYNLVPRGDGSYQARGQAYPTEFNDLELYLMGLLPAGEVGEHFVFNDQTQPAGGTPPDRIMQGPVTRFTVNDLVVTDGQRVPAYGNAQTEFRLGTIVLSRNRLLEAHEMAHFEYMAARGEATTEMDASLGVLITKVKPFYLSTRTKAKLSTTVCSECAGAATSVSSASFRRGGDLAPESIASTFGFGLTDTVQIATAQPLPDILDGTSVRVTDSARGVQNSPLFFISQGQINLVVPRGTVTGAATVDVIHDGQTVATGQVNIATVAPALFAANADGKGVPAANVIRVVHPVQGNPVVTYESPAQCGTTYGSCTPKPIDLGAANVEVFLELYGTGIRGRTSLAGVTCTIGGAPARVDYAGPVSGLAGLDQVNVLIPRSLAGRGEVDLALNVDGKPANTMKINTR
jgi:uncharacterized protein (TIGR03437 family)